jgi:dTDP-4-amino-4,6-dideoxygalactose transaminase
MASKLPAGGEVLISTHTMVATAASAHFAGLRAVPVGVESDHLVSVRTLESSVTSDTVAICPTQLNGRTARMDEICDWAASKGLKVFEDAAQGLGSFYKNRMAGTWGTASCLSFYPAKILGTLGDGGAVLTNDDAIAYEVQLLRDHGRIDRAETVAWGFNARLDNLAAAFLLVQFKHFDETVSRRRQIAQAYCDGLKGIDGVLLPPSPKDGGEHFDTFQNFEIECGFRESLESHLAERRIGFLRQWGGWGIHQFSKLGFDEVLPEEDRRFNRMLMLPIYPSMTDEQVEIVIREIQACNESRRSE